MRANVPRDFQLFVNLVDFLQLFIQKTETKFILKWIPTFVAAISDSVNKCSLISGFYTLMGTVFSLIKRTSYFLVFLVFFFFIIKKCSMHIHN